MFGGVDPSASYMGPHGTCWGTLREDSREGAYAEGRRLGMECLVEIEGVLHRRAALQM